MMEQISLSPSGPDAVQFVGDLMIAVQGDDGTKQTDGRWHGISIYRTGTGNLATYIAYRIQVPAESEQCHVDLAEDMADVDNVLSLYDLSQHIVMEAGHARNLGVDAVIRNYDLQVNDDLEHLQSLPADDASSKPR